MLRTWLGAMMLAVSLAALADESAYPTNQCIDRLPEDPRLGAIADKVALSRSNETSPAMFELDRPASGAEQSALELWSRLRQACFDFGADFRRARASPEQAALAGGLFGLHQGMLGELREGRITYAGFNRRRVEIYLFAASLEAQMIDGDQALSPEPPLLPAGHSEI